MYLTVIQLNLPCILLVIVVLDLLCVTGIRVFDSTFISVLLKLPRVRTPIRRSLMVNQESTINYVIGIFLQICFLLYFLVTPFNEAKHVLTRSIFGEKYCFVKLKKTDSLSQHNFFQVFI